MTRTRGRLGLPTHQPIVTTEDTENTEGQTLVRRSPQGEEDQPLGAEALAEETSTLNCHLAAQLRGAKKSTDFADPQDGGKPLTAIKSRLVTGLLDLLALCRSNVAGRPGASPSPKTRRPWAHLGAPRRGHGRYKARPFIAKGESVLMGNLWTMMPRSFA
jgi:hypothetical protein